MSYSKRTVYYPELLWDRAVKQTNMRYIHAYTPAWIHDFETIARFLRPKLPDNATIHHIGSTAIPGMPAKDIIDIDIECPAGSMKRVIASLWQAGYTHEGDRGIPAREAFTPRKTTQAARLRPHHLYACEQGASELARHLAFRDYLIVHPERAGWLADAKRAADAEAIDRTAYIKGKAVAYQKIVAEAMKWMVEQGR